MEIDYRGANCVVIKNKKILIVVDPTTNVSVKEANNSDAVILATQEKFAQELLSKQGEVGKDAEKDAKNFVIDMPGEYERNDVTVKGVAARAHLDADEKAQNATMYAVEADDIRIAIIGHTVAPLTDDDLENLGMVDIVIIPVGGGGYTLDSRDATTIARQIAPKIVIPTHYADAHVRYEVPQEPVDEFIKEMGGAHEKVTALKLKSENDLPDGLTVVELARTA